MPPQLNKTEIIENLKLLSDLLRVKHPGEVFELTLVGGAAMALNGFKGQTRDIDLLWPNTLPDSLKHGVARVAKIRRLSPDWINTNVANILRRTGPHKLPEYFHEISKTIDIGNNLRIKLIGRQALITLKLFAATPSYAKHTTDLRSLKPKNNEIEEALRFVLSIDNNSLRRQT